MTTELNLGQIITTQQYRDAIHIAVAPIEATQTLYPGQHVGLMQGKGVLSDKPIGIVDPFLREPVQPGHRFWLFLYPNTVTSLRHSWSHPAFGAVVPTPTPSNTSKESSNVAS